jgi:Zn-dependent M28 family amino/carboxypeptidase
MRLVVATSLTLLLSCAASAQLKAKFDPLKDNALKQLGAYHMLEELSGGIGPRIAGSENAAKAVDWAKQKMESLGFEHVRLLPCMVPHWVRGSVEKCEVVGSTDPGAKLTCCALGQSLGTPDQGIDAGVIEVHSLKEAQALGEKAKGKIIFFNRPFDSTKVQTFEAYGMAGDQRFGGPAVAAKLGAAAALVRSMTADHDDVPHTGVTDFPSGAPKIPAAALSLVAADYLSDYLKQHAEAQVHLTLSCTSLPDVLSYDVIGDLPGTTGRNEVVLMGGHLDSWDKGRGAHDDGAGVVHSLEALRLLHDMGWKPKRTIRVVLWMDEEQEGKGAEAYFNFVKGYSEKPVAAIESDSGGFAPRSFGSSLNLAQVRKLSRFVPLFQSYELQSIDANGETGADVEPLAKLHVPLFGLVVESQRYFNYHHSEKDTIDKVDPRELELGAIDMALLAWILANY